jgi:hypothetical protein
VSGAPSAYDPSCPQRAGERTRGTAHGRWLDRRQPAEPEVSDLHPGQRRRGVPRAGGAAVGHHRHPRERRAGVAGRLGALRGVRPDRVRPRQHRDHRRVRGLLLPERLDRPHLRGAGARPHTRRHRPHLLRRAARGAALRTQPDRREPRAQRQGGRDAAVDPRHHRPRRAARGRGAPDPAAGGPAGPHGADRGRAGGEVPGPHARPLPTAVRHPHLHHLRRHRAHRHHRPGVRRRRRPHPGAHHHRRRR